MTISTVDHQLPDDTHDVYDVRFYGRSIRTVVTHSPPIVSSWLSSRGSEPLLVGLATEWRPNTRYDDYPVAVLQLAVGLHCLIFQILHAPKIPPSLADFLRDPRHVFVGVGINEDLEKLLGGYNLRVGIKEDVDKLYCEYGLRVANAVDLSAFAASKLGRPHFRTTGLKTLAMDVLGWKMEKPRHVSRSRWDKLPLKSEQVEYACLDAFVSLQIGGFLSAGGGGRP